jgi:hypothetical protein
LTKEEPSGGKKEGSMPIFMYKEKSCQKNERGRAMIHDTKSPIRFVLPE